MGSELQMSRGISYFLGFCFISDCSFIARVLFTALFHHTRSQAFAAWQWWNFYNAQVAAGKQLLKINLDETSLRLFQGDGRGIIFASKNCPAPVQSVTRAKRRSCLTHVAFICDEPSIQPVLPQILIGNETTIPASALAALKERAPANVRLLPQKSAWNNERVCAWIVRILAAALAPA